MSDKPTDITLERIARLTTAVADLMEGSNRQGRDILRALSGMGLRLDRMDVRLVSMDQRLVSVDERLVSIERDVRELASEQAILGNRVEEAFSRALRVSMRLDEMDGR